MPPALDVPETPINSSTVVIQGLKDVGIIKEKVAVVTKAVPIEEEVVDTQKQAKTLRFDTLQVHAGLEENPAHGQCTLPIYNSASFKFSTAQADRVFGEDGLRSRHLYSRLSNPTNDGFEKRIAALEGGSEAVSFSSGASAILTMIMSLAIAGDNVIATNQLFGGTYHQFQELALQVGIECRFCDTNDIAKVRALVDDKTKFVFTEIISNPKLTVADLEPLAELCHEFGMPLVVDGTFSASGYWCRPGHWGADIVVHSATKWIGGHGTTMGGIIVDTGNSDWQANSDRFPQLHGKRLGSHGSTSLYKTEKNRSWMYYLKFDMMKDMGTNLSPLAAQQLFVGVQTLSLRCERQAQSASTVAHWLRKHPRVAWVNYLGFEDHPSHAVAKKYLHNGFCSVLNFGLKGGFEEGQKMTDGLQFIVNTLNVGQSATIIGNQWSTTQKGCPKELNDTFGVFPDQYRLSIGIEDVRDIIEDLDQAIRKAANSTL